MGTCLTATLLPSLSLNWLFYACFYSSHLHAYISTFVYYILGIIHWLATMEQTLCFLSFLVMYLLCLFVYWANENSSRALLRHSHSNGTWYICFLCCCWEFCLFDFKGRETERGRDRFFLACCFTPQVVAVCSGQGPAEASSQELPPGLHVSARGCSPAAGGLEMETCDSTNWLQVGHVCLRWQSNCCAIMPGPCLLIYLKSRAIDRKKKTVWGR